MVLFYDKQLLLLQKKNPKHVQHGMLHVCLGHCASYSNELLLICVPKEMSAASTLPIWFTHKQLSMSMIIMFHTNAYHLCSTLSSGIHSLVNWVLSPFFPCIIPFFRKKRTHAYGLSICTFASKDLWKEQFIISTMGEKKWEDGGSVPRSSLNIEFSKTLERER